MTLDLFAATATVPDGVAIPTVAELEKLVRELADAHPDVARLREVGCSSEGRPILALEIGTGDRTALVYGGPHANELVGASTVAWLAEELCRSASLRDELGLRWAIVPSIDPDGHARNEGWIDDPARPSRYHRGFYRPPSDRYPDWLFPVDHATWRLEGPTLPEAQALQALIDDVQPAFVYALHNAEYGGAFFYVTEADGATAAALSDLPGRVGVPVERVQQEFPGAEVLAPGVFELPSPAKLYDLLLAAGVPDPAGLLPPGANAGHYAARYGAVTLVTEVPYWRDPRAGDGSPSGRTMAAVVSEQCEHIDAFLAEVDAVTAALGHAPESVFLPAALDVRRMMARVSAGQRGLLEATPEIGRAPCTVGEAFSRGDAWRSYLQRGRGMLLRHLDIVAPGADTALAAARDRLAAAFDAEAARLDDSSAAAIPLRDLVRIQATAGLRVASFAAARVPVGGRP